VWVGVVARSGIDASVSPIETMMGMGGFMGIVLSGFTRCLPPRSG
jgi:hypothetical protein